MLTPPPSLRAIELHAIDHLRHGRQPARPLRIEKRRERLGRRHVHDERRRHVLREHRHPAAEIDADIRERTLLHRVHAEHPGQLVPGLARREPAEHPQIVEHVVKRALPIAHGGRRHDVRRVRRHPPRGRKRLRSAPARPWPHRRVRVPAAAGNHERAKQLVHAIHRATQPCTAPADTSGNRRRNRHNPRRALHDPM